MEAVARKLQEKADFEKVQAMQGELRAELSEQMAAVRKEAKKKAVKKKQDADLTAREQDFANEKLFEEIRSFKEKLTKLANQFDKELLERDRQLKSY